MKRVVIGLVIVLLLGLGIRYTQQSSPIIGLGDARSFLGHTATNQTYVLAAGSVVNNQQVSLSSQVPGQILSIPEQNGTAIKAGQVVVRLDPTDAQNAANQALAAVAAAKAHLAILLQGATPAQRQVSQAGVDSASTALANAQRALQQAQATQQAEVAQAKSALDNENALYQHELYTPASDTQRASYLAQLQAAQTAYQTTQSQTQAQVVAAQNLVNQAQATFQQAQSQSQQTTAPPTSAEVSAAQAAVDQAEAAAAEAQQNLSETQVTSPISGTVAQSLFRPGDRVLPNQPLVILASSAGQSLQVVVNVSGDDIGRVKVGDGAILTVPDLNLQGLSAGVSYISPNGLSQGGQTLYPVTLTVPATAARLRSGQLVDARIRV